MSSVPPNGGPPIDDDVLHAFVDGRLDAAMRARVVAWLDANPEQAARVADWQAANEALRAAYEPVAQEPVPARLMAFTLAQENRFGFGWRQAAAGLALLALGVGGIFRVPGTGSVAGAPGIRRIVPERIRRGWRPDPMWWLVVSWMMIMFTYFVVNLWITGLHSYAGLGQ